MTTSNRFLLSLLFVFNMGLAQAQTNPSIHFAWLTDTHIGGSTGAADLRIVVEDINKNDSIDFVIVSGDITELDVAPNLHLAKRILDSLNVPYHIIPGNHDTKWTSSGGGLFEQLWGADRFNFEVGEFRFIGHHQGPLMRMGAGYIDPDDIAWIDSILTSLTDPRQKIFMVMHYPLDPAIDNWYNLRDILRPHNIQAVMHGHGHSNQAISYEGIPGVMSRSTLRRGAQPTGYTLANLYSRKIDFFERVPLSDSLHFWHSLALGDRDFSDSLKLPYPDYSANATSGVKEVWQVATGSLITSSPKLSGNQVFVSTVSGKVLSLDVNSGEELWSWKGDGMIHSTPAVKGSRLVIGSVDSSITCLSTKNGRQLWQTRTNDPVLGSPVIDGRQVLVGSGDGVMRALKLRNGKLNWSYSDIEGYIETRPIVKKGKVMFGAWDGSFYAVNARHGTLAWKWTGPRRGLLYSPAACWPVATDENVFIVAPDRAMTAIDIASGATVWRKDGHKVRESIGMSQDGKTIFARTMSDSALAVSSESENFTLKWIERIGFDYDIAPNAIIERAGQIFFATDNGMIYCLDSTTGKVVWRHRISAGLVNTLEMVDDHRLVCTGADGNVSLLAF